MRVIIDPGHGGSTVRGGSTPYGRRASTGRSEKELTLALARRLARRIRSAQLTRSTDHNLSLGERIGAARDAGCGVFLSLHADTDTGGVFLHEHADGASQGLARSLADSLRMGAPSSRELAVLHPRWHGATTAACMVDLGLERLARASERELDELADQLARGVERYGARHPTALSTPKLFDGGVWSFPATDGTILLWYGTQKPASDESHLWVAKTLGYAMEVYGAEEVLGNVSIKLVGGWNKQALFDAIAAEEDGTIIAVHYIGHGSTGGLYCGYDDPQAKAKRTTVSRELASMRGAKKTDGELRAYAVKHEPSLMAGVFEDARLRGAVRKKLHSKCFFHIWGCYAGGAGHRFDADEYWNTFNVGAGDTDSISVHLAKELDVEVIAPQGTGGAEFWFRRSKKVRQDDRSKSIFRPKAVPQWMWPHAKAEWVTREGGTGRALHTEKGGRPATGLTEKDGRNTKLGQDWPHYKGLQRPVVHGARIQPVIPPGADPAKVKQRWQQRYQRFAAGVGFPWPLLHPHNAICQLRVLKRSGPKAGKGIYQPDGDHNDEEPHVPADAGSGDGGRLPVVGQGTGFIIEGGRILTAAHVLDGAVDIEIFVGLAGSRQLHHTTAKGSQVRLHGSYGTTRYGSDFDLALIVGVTDLPWNTGEIELEALDAAPITVCGYAGEEVDADYQHEDTGDIDRQTADSVFYRVQTRAGSSGAPGMQQSLPVITRHRAVSVHSAASSTWANVGCRLTPQKIRWALKTT